MIKKEWNIGLYPLVARRKYGDNAYMPEKVFYAQMGSAAEKLFNGKSVVGTLNRFLISKAIRPRGRLKPSIEKELRSVRPYAAYALRCPYCTAWFVGSIDERGALTFEEDKTTDYVSPAAPQNAPPSALLAKIKIGPLPISDAETLYIQQLNAKHK